MTRVITPRSEPPGISIFNLLLQSSAAMYSVYTPVGLCHCSNHTVMLAVAILVRIYMCFCMYNLPVSIVHCLDTVYGLMK